KALKGKIKNGGKDTETKIKGLWEQSKALSESKAERISIGWHKFHSKSDANTALIKAKLHLTYAEIYQFTTNKSKEAGVELDKAKTCLKSAEKNANSKTRTKIDAIVEELSQIKAGLGSKKEAARDRYEKVKADMLQLIRKL
ncbi:MAG: hypothetical protein GWP10_00450, partial [Nitrospiraceae bacterium]|nr:hypothetical protein [Nitrospiraceae bacterium]